MPQGIDTPGVDELPQGDETLGLANEGEGVTGEDGRERGGDRKPPPPELTRREELTAATRTWCAG